MQADLDNVGSAYARALIEVAQQGNTLEAVHADVDGLSNILRSDSSVTAFLSNPTMNEDKKKELLGNLAKEAGFNEATTNFLYLLVDKQRLEAIEEIADAFETEYCKLTDTQVGLAEGWSSRSELDSLLCWHWGVTNSHT